MSYSAKLSKIMIWAVILAATLPGVSFAQSCSLGRDVLFFVDDSGSISNVNGEDGTSEYSRLWNSIRGTLPDSTTVAPTGLNPAQDRFAVVAWSGGPAIKTLINWSPADRSRMQANPPTSRPFGGGTNLQDSIYTLSYYLASSVTRPADPDARDLGTTELSPFDNTSGRQLVVIILTDGSGEQLMTPRKVGIVYPSSTGVTEFFFSNLLKGTLTVPDSALNFDFRAVKNFFNNARPIVAGIQTDDLRGLPFLGSVASVARGNGVGAPNYACQHTKSFSEPADKSTSVSCTAESSPDAAVANANPRRLVGSAPTITTELIAPVLASVITAACPELSKAAVPTPPISASGGVVGTDIGGRIEYTLTLRNVGSSAITGQLFDKVPRNTTFESAAAGGQYNAQTEVVSWDVSAAAGQSVTRSFTVRIKADTPPTEAFILNDAYSASVTLEGVSQTITGPIVRTPIVRRTGSLQGNVSATKVFDGAPLTLSRTFRIDGGDAVACTTRRINGDSEYPRVQAGRTEVEFVCDTIALVQRCTPDCFVEVTPRTLNVGYSRTQFVEGDAVNEQTLGATLTAPVQGFPVTLVLTYLPSSQTCPVVAPSNATNPPTSAGTYRVCPYLSASASAANYRLSPASAIGQEITLLPRLTVQGVQAVTLGSTLTGIRFVVSGGGSQVANVSVQLTPPVGVALAALGPVGTCSASASGEVRCNPAVSEPGVSCSRSNAQCSIQLVPASGGPSLIAATRGPNAPSLVGTVVTLQPQGAGSVSCTLTANACVRN